MPGIVFCFIFNMHFFLVNFTLRDTHTQQASSAPAHNKRARVHRFIDCATKAFAPSPWQVDRHFAPETHAHFYRRGGGVKLTIHNRERGERRNDVQYKAFGFYYYFQKPIIILDILVSTIVYIH